MPVNVKSYFADPGRGHRGRSGSLLAKRRLTVPATAQAKIDEASRSFTSSADMLVVVVGKGRDPKGAPGSVVRAILPQGAPRLRRAPASRINGARRGGWVGG